jgi:hypothetical protein
MGDLLQPWHLLVLLIVPGFFCLVPAIFYILTLSRALNKCSPASRTLEPGMLWLLLVPFVNLVWHFFVVLGMAKSLSNELRLRNIPVADPTPGQSIGIAMCVCGACTIIPILGIIAALALLVLWIVYWAKIAEFSRILDQTPMTNPMQGASIG